MAPMIVTTQPASPPFEPCCPLPKKRNEWSAYAQNSYREVIGELDAWSRRQDAPKIMNSWIAEEAVRRSW